MRMGLSKEEFFSLTPRLFAELVRQYRRGQRETHTLLALLRLDVINFSYRAPRERITLDDLLPPDADEQPVKRPRLTEKRRQYIAEGFRRFFANAGAVEVKHGRPVDEPERAEGARPEARATEGTGGPASHP
jgi:hypothetical protein